jgi:hypothetical protein
MNFLINYDNVTNIYSCRQGSTEIATRCDISHLLFYLPASRRIVIALCIEYLPRKEIAIDMDGVMHYKRTAYGRVATRSQSEKDVMDPVRSFVRTVKRIAHVKLSLCFN